MIPKRNPYATASSTSIPAPTDYPSVPPLLPEPPSAPASPLTPIPTPNSYPYAGAGTIQSQVPTSSSTAVPVAHLEISTPSQAAIIAISVICGLLLIALLFLILVMIGKRHEREVLRVGIGGGGGGGGNHRRKRRSERSYTEFGDESLRRFELGRRGMDQAYFRAGPEMGMRRAGFGGDPKMRDAGRGERDVEEVEEVEEESEVGTARADGGTRSSRSGSERGRRSEKASRSHSKRHHRG